jgi:hypothetical protein
MIEGRVRTIMSEATDRFAKKEGVKPNEISIVIHTKNEHCIPQYYYMVKNSPKRDADNNILELKFKRDILNKVFDPLGTEGLASQFLSNKFKYYEELYSDQQVKAQGIYFMLHPKDEKASDFDVFLLHQKSLLKKISLEEIMSM